MKNVINSIIVAFSEILRFNSMKIVLISGAIVTAFWVGVGFVVWDSLMALSAKIIEYIPFSMVRSNGAWMLSAFLWFQLVLITFAIIYAFFGNIILKKVSKERYSSFSFITVAISAIFWSIVWLIAGDSIYQEFLKLLNLLPFETIEKGIATLIGLYIIYNAIIVTMLFIASIFSEPLIKSIREKHFGEDDIVKENTFASIRYTIKDTLIFLALSVVAFPLLFIPVINLLVQIALWIWLVKDTLSFDALSMVSKDIEKNLIKEHKVGVYFISFVTVLFNFLPIFNIFGPFFGEIAMYHYFKNIKKNS